MDKEIEKELGCKVVAMKESKGSGYIVLATWKAKTENVVKVDGEWVVKNGTKTEYVTMWWDGIGCRGEYIYHYKNLKAAMKGYEWRN